MIFGEIPLDEAEGAILVHGVRAGKLTFKKGRRLSAEDVARLSRRPAMSGSWRSVWRPVTSARIRRRRSWPRRWPGRI